MSHARLPRIKSLEDVDDHKGDYVMPAVFPFSPEVESLKVHKPHPVSREAAANALRT